jgi:hypothetical protein
MTNSRCLTEGVDLPAIDCVVFTDPKKSKVDIVQAAGRALRLSPGKKFGYILIPLIIPENENATEAAKDTAFEEIVATIRALATQDSRIIEYLRAVSSGKIPKGGSPVDGITKINVLTKVNEEEFNKSIQLKVWDRVAFGNWRSYEEAKKYAQLLKLKSWKEWVKNSKLKSFPIDLPTKPEKSYKKQWISWGEFLGTGIISNSLKFFKSYSDTKLLVRSLKIKNVREWIKYTKSKKFPKDIPKSLQKVYFKEWESWGKFLGTGIVSNKFKKFRSYSEAKEHARSLKIKGQIEWFKYTKSKKFPKDIPIKPYFYKKEWKSWGDFLGTGNVSTRFRKYKKYSDVKTYVLNLKLNKREEWKDHIKSSNFPKDIPKAPQLFYKNEWKGWGDFLETGRKFAKRK